MAGLWSCGDFAVPAGIRLPRVLEGCGDSSKRAPQCGLEYYILMFGFYGG